MGKILFCSNKLKPSTHKRTMNHSYDFMEIDILLFGNKYSNSKIPDGYRKKFNAKYLTLISNIPTFYSNIIFPFERIMSSFQVPNGNLLQIGY